MDIQEKLIEKAKKLYNEGLITKAHQLALTSIEIKATFSAFEMASITAPDIKTKNYYLKQSLETKIHNLKENLQSCCFEIAIKIRIDLIKNYSILLHKFPQTDHSYLAEINKIVGYDLSGNRYELYEIYRNIYQSFKNLSIDLKWDIVKKIEILFHEDKLELYDVYLGIYQSFKNLPDKLKSYIAKKIEMLFITNIAFSNGKQITTAINQMPSEIALKLKNNNKNLPLEILKESLEENYKKYCSILNKINQMRIYKEIRMGSEILPNLQKIRELVNKSDPKSYIEADILINKTNRMFYLNSFKESLEKEDQSPNIEMSIVFIIFSAFISPVLYLFVGVFVSIFSNLSNAAVSQEAIKYTIIICIILAIIATISFIRMEFKDSKVRRNSFKSLIDFLYPTKNKEVINLIENFYKEDFISIPSSF